MGAMQTANILLRVFGSICTLDPKILPIQAVSAVSNAEIAEVQAVFTEEINPEYCEYSQYGRD